MSEDVLPLSLKQYCLLYVVTNINRIPLLSLLLLPISLRRTLLHYLPGITIHELEGTAFLDSIDTSVYWDQLYTQYKPALPVPMDEYEFVKKPFGNPGSISPLPVNSKEKILDSVVREIVCSVNSATVAGPMPSCACGYKFSIPFAVLYCVRNLFFFNADQTDNYTSFSSPSVEVLLKYYDIQIICEHLNLIVRNSYSENSTKKCRVDMINTLVTTFNKYPKVLNSSLFGLKIHEQQDAGDFFSQTESLCLSGGRNVEDHLVSYVKNFVASNSLKTLLINTELSSDQLHHILPYFSQSKGSIRNLSAKYNSLEQLSAGKFLKQEKHPNEGKNPIEDVSSIISFQNSLRNVRLYGYFGYSSATETLMSCLSKLVKQPQLESLMIEGYNRNCRVSMEMFSKIILHFLLNETSHYQNLTFTNFELFDTKLTSLKMATLSHSLSKVPSCNLKSLDISGIRLPMEVVRMLNRIEPCCFDVLALSLDSTTGYYTELSKFCNSVKYILTLNLDKHSLTIDEDVIAKQVAHFIAKPTIQSLVLNFISLSRL